MGSCFRFVVRLTVRLWGWIASDIHAQDDLIAKAQSERVLINGHSNQAMLLTAGEFPVIIYSDIARTEELKRKSAPSEWVTRNLTSPFWSRPPSLARRSTLPPPGCS